MSNKKQMLYTPEGYKVLTDELNFLKTVRREEIKEAIAVANAAGCTLNYEEELEHCYEVSRATDETISSMVQAVTHHRETEIRIINGAVVKLGEQYGIPTPCNEMILNLVLAKQSLYLGC